MNNRISKFISNISITNKITLLYGSVFAAAFILTSAFMMANASFYYRDVSKQELIALADSISDQISQGKDITSITDETQKPDKYTSFFIVPLTGSPEESAPGTEPFGTARAPLLEPPQPFGNASTDAPVPVENPFTPGERRFFSISAKNMPYMFHNKFAEYDGQHYLIHVARHYAREQRVLRLFAMIFVVANVIGIICAFLIGRYISKKMLRPIMEISRAAERISMEDLNRRIEIFGPDDEVKKLAVTFNDMLDRLESSFGKQNQFVSDASHELRTPISVIQGYANLIDRWGKSDPAVLQESIDSIKAETEHMSMLIKKLLFLARGQQNAKHVQKMPLSLNSVAEEVLKEVTVMEIPHKVSLIEESRQTIVGDFDLIKQMLWIFLENSFKYTDKGTVSVIIKVYGEDGRALISVSDDGIGIDREDLPHIFERFYRADKSRSQNISGAGLGLSIADWIIKLHEGSATAQSKKGEGTEIVVSFPET